MSIILAPTVSTAGSAAEGNDPADCCHPQLDVVLSQSNAPPSGDDGA